MNDLLGFGLFIQILYVGSFGKNNNGFWVTNGTFGFCSHVIFFSIFDFTESFESNAKATVGVEIFFAICVYAATVFCLP